MTSSQHLVRYILMLVVSALFLILEPSCASAQNDDEEAVKNHVENFLTALAEGNLDELTRRAAAFIAEVQKGRA